MGDERAFALADTNHDDILSEGEFERAARPASEMAPPHSAACEVCGAGRASLSAGAVWGDAPAQCTVCPAGSFAPVAAARCTLCPAGRFSGVTGAATSAVCEVCAAGKISRTPGAISEAACEPCPAGSYPTVQASGGGASACTLCPAGRATAPDTTAASVSAAACVDCAPGRYSAGFPAPGASSCVDCAPGRFLYEPPLEGVQLQLFLARPHAPCELCDAGRWSDASAAYGPSQSACQACPPGLYSRDAGSDSLGDCQVRNEMLRTSGARPHARRLWLAAGLASATAAAATL